MDHSLQNLKNKETQFVKYIISQDIYEIPIKSGAITNGCDSIQTPKSWKSKIGSMQN